MGIKSMFLVEFPMGAWGSTPESSNELNQSTTTMQSLNTVKRYNMNKNALKKSNIPTIYPVSNNISLEKNRSKENINTTISSVNSSHMLNTSLNKNMNKNINKTMNKTMNKNMNKNMNKTMNKNKKNLPSAIAPTIPSSNINIESGKPKNGATAPSVNTNTSNTLQQVGGRKNRKSSRKNRK